MHPHVPARILAVVVLVVLMTMAWPLQAKTRLLVYSAVDAEELKKYAEQFHNTHPDIELRWVHDSTGIITARLLAEQERPRADVIWGLAVTSLLVLKEKGLLLPYAPAGVEKLDPRFRDRADPPFWTGTAALVAAICYNTIEGRKHQVPPPTAWKDLTMPAHKGHVAMPNPLFSGTGFLNVSSWLQIFGEVGGWAFMDALHANISYYTHSGSKPCKQAAAGEVVTGIAFDLEGRRLKARGAPLEVIIPSEGVGWEMGATAIVQGTRHLAAAQKLVDWAVTEEANRLYSEGFAVVTIPGLSKPLPHFPSGVLDAMIPNDFAWAARHRQAILAEWQKRYDTKSERQ
jgi:iron(III) transport system substrate-binding protein